ncbi:MAG TPA: DNA topoisomerase IB [Solimonas sp.]|nr:DNA topoisomerase IB [Solimonas sp.]
MPDSGLPPSPALAAGLRYASDAEPGIRRVRRGRGFGYVDAGGAPLRDAAMLARIRMLAIPPAYVDVWICADPDGHLQATGRDARGRKQYRYHERWRTQRSQGKFGRMHDFGLRLPALRRCLRRDLELPGLPRTKVLAAVVSMLESTLVRVGNSEYARDNGSYGLTTLRDQHVQFHSLVRARLRFRGKSGQPHDIELNDARLIRIVRSCQELPGQQLFQYLDAHGKPQRVDSGMVNEYLGQAMGEDFTAKDFRTWGATLRAIACIGCVALPEPPSERALKACISAAVKQVAAGLNNTPAVCRKSYIHPGVFEAWRAGALPGCARPRRGLRKAECEALAFLEAAAVTAPAAPATRTGRPAR